MNLRRALATGVTVAFGGAAAYVAERTVARRWRAPAGAVVAAGRTMPADIRHHFLDVSDGGRIHVTERGDGPAVVFLHGITLGVATWAPELRALGGRTIAIAWRGHGQSRAGREGYSFERLGADVLEVLRALDVEDAVLVGHSMGGMVAQLLAVEHPEELAHLVRRLVLVATSPGPLPISPLAAFVDLVSSRLLAARERHGRGPLPGGLTIWAARAAFGRRPSAVDVELLRAMLDTMSPGPVAAFLPHLLTFDVRDRLEKVELPTTVVSGTRDALTPPRTARAIARRVPGASLTLLEGCGHMVMLERVEELCAALR